MRADDSASYGHIHPRWYDEYLRVSFHCEEFDRYENRVGNDVRRWRFEVDGTHQKELVARTHVVVLALDQTDPDPGRYTSEHPYEMIARTTDDEYNWRDGHPVAQYSSTSPINVTAALFRVLEEINVVLRGRDRIEES